MKIDIPLNKETKSQFHDLNQKLTSLLSFEFRNVSNLDYKI